MHGQADRSCQLLRPVSSCSIGEAPFTTRLRMRTNLMIQSPNRCTYTIAEAECRLLPTFTRPEPVARRLRSSSAITELRYERRDYFRDRFTADELRRILRSANAVPMDVLSTRSRVYRDRRAEIDAMDDEELLAAMVAEPTLVRRPLVISEGRLVTGFDRQGLQSIAEQHDGSK